MSPDFPSWWTRSFALVKTTWRPMVILQLWALLPFLVPGLILVLTWESDAFGPPRRPARARWTGPRS